MAISLMLFSAIFIQQHLGRIEMHFHVFLAMPILIRYKDALPVIAAASTTIIHHLVFNYCQAYNISLFNTPLWFTTMTVDSPLPYCMASLSLSPQPLYLHDSREYHPFCKVMFVQAENIRMGTELDITRRLQHMLLPKQEELSRIKELDIACFMQPASEVGEIITMY